jgi:hypothetical protein
MPKYWLISDRNNNGTGQGMNTAGLTYWVSDGGDLTSIGSWQKVRNARAFQTLLANAADNFPADVPKRATKPSHASRARIQRQLSISDEFLSEALRQLVYRPGFFERPMHLI